MAEDDGHAHRPRLRIVVLVHVAAADADAADAHQNLVVGHLGHRHVRSSTAPFFISVWTTAGI